MFGPLPEERASRALLQTEDQKPIENKPEGGRSGRPSNRSTSRESIIIRTTHRADDRAIVPRYQTEGIPGYLNPTMVNHACPRARAPIVPPTVRLDADRTFACVRAVRPVVRPS